MPAVAFPVGVLIFFALLITVELLTVDVGVVVCELEICDFFLFSVFFISTSMGVLEGLLSLFDVVLVLSGVESTGDNPAVYDFCSQKFNVLLDILPLLLIF